MYAMACDLLVAETERQPPRGIPQAYADIGAILSEYGFSHVQSRLYFSDNEDMANLFLATQAWRKRDWFPKSVRDIRSFRVEPCSDFTPIVKG